MRFLTTYFPSKKNYPLVILILILLSLFFQCDAEVNFLEGQIGLPASVSSVPNNRFAQPPQLTQQNQQQTPQPGSQLEMVLQEARRLEEIAHRNEDELRLLALEQQRNSNLSNELLQLQAEEDPNIRAEIMQLKQRLAGTDTELQKTNQTLR